MYNIVTTDILFLTGNPVDPNLFPSSTNTGDRDKSSSAHLIAKLHGMFRDLPPPSYSKSNLPGIISAMIYLS